MADTNNDTTVMKEVVEEKKCGEYKGCTKWFNDRLGYGFITICEGPKKGEDIFVHHVEIKPINSNYRTLKKGEYIQFDITKGMNGPQASHVTGICGGPLMCDSDIKNRSNNNYYTKKRPMKNDGGMDVDDKSYKIRDNV